MDFVFAVNFTWLARLAVYTIYSPACILSPPTRSARATRQTFVSVNECKLF